MSSPIAISHTQPIAIVARNGDSALESASSSAKGTAPLSLSIGSSTTRDSGSNNTPEHNEVPLYSPECTSMQSPQMRKRKLKMEGREACSPKRRSPERNEPRKILTQSSVLSNSVTNSFIEEMADIRGPSLLKRTLGLQSDRYSQYIGPTTDFEPSLINLSPFDPQDESLLSRGTLRKVSEVDTFLMLPDYTTPGHEYERDDLDIIEQIVSPHGSHLLELYFRIIHPNFPVIQQTVFFENYNHSHIEFPPALLAAVYILAINWWDHNEELSGQPRPNLRELERMARVTLADAMYRPKLSTIQAGLLLSQRPEGDQWAPTAQLVAIGQELGLHLDCSSWKIPIWERGLRKRLAWALFMQDKWGSLVHGRPSHIFASNWAVQPLFADDFGDVEYEDAESAQAMEHERGRLLFTQMVTLSQILAEVLETFYALQAMAVVSRAGNHGAHLILQRAKPIQLKLKEWFSALPPCLRMDAPSIFNNTKILELSSTGFLHLSYFATEITLHRRIIRTLSSTPPAAMDDDPNGVDPYVIHICRSAAKTRLISAMDFVNRLSSSHLRSFWYFASKMNFALIGTFGSLLWATAPAREEAEWYRRRLAEYRWTLGVSCKGDGGDGGGGSRGLTKFAMGMLDTSTGLLKALPEKPALIRVGSMSEHVRSTMKQRSMVEGYGYGFKGSAGDALDIDIGALRCNGTERDVKDTVIAAMRSGLASPSTSVSSGGLSDSFVTPATTRCKESY